MKKVYLLSYKPTMFQSLNGHGHTYDLKTLEVSFFGLIKREVESVYTVPYHHNLKSYTERWDELIKTKHNLKKDFE